MNDLLEALFSRRKRLPVIMAAEAAECGLACMAMVGRYHGHQIDLNGLRQRFSLSLTGTTLRSLMTLASEMSFATRALRVSLEALDKIQTPAVLHWDLNHFVVLKSATAKAVQVHDPARGARTLSWAEASRHFTGVVLELTPTAEFCKVEARHPIRLHSLWSNATGLWRASIQVLGLSAALQVVTFAAPLQLQFVVDDAVARGDRSLLVLLAFGFGALVIMQALLEALRGWALQVFGSLFIFQVVGNLVRHLLYLPSEFFEKRHVGDILSRIGSTTFVQDAVTKGLVSALLDGSMALVAAGILFIYSPSLAFVVLAGVAANLVVAAVAYPVIRARTEEQLVFSASERSHLMESVRAATTIKLMGRETERENAWRNLYANSLNATVSVAKYQLGSTFARSAITGLSTIAVITLGARAILSGGFTVGMLMAFLSFRQTFSDRTSALIDQLVQFKLLGLHLERIGDIVAQSPDPPTASRAGPDVRGAIHMVGVSFRYGTADSFVLQDLHLNVAPNEFIAIIGPSGGGKSTLLKLLSGLRAPTEGQIYLDGQLAAPAYWAAWRAHVGVVAQDDQLLSGTIADNISFFDPDLEMTRVQKAAEAAQIHAEIARMPMQYNTLIGEMGSSLSAGQRQRVLLARALYREPKILILDEGTANLDEATETAIADLISRLEMTRIVVAHRPALIQRADRVVAMTGGKLLSANISLSEGANRSS